MDVDGEGLRSPPPPQQFRPANRGIMSFSNGEAPRPPQPRYGPYSSQPTQTFAPGQGYPAMSHAPTFNLPPPPVPPYSSRPRPNQGVPSLPVAQSNSYRFSNRPTSPPIAPPNSHQSGTARAAQPAPSIIGNPSGGWGFAPINEDSPGPDIDRHITATVSKELDERFGRGERESRTSYKPFKNPAPSFRRPRSSAHNNMMVCSIVLNIEKVLT